MTLSRRQMLGAAGGATVVTVTAGIGASTASEGDEAGARKTTGAAGGDTERVFVHPVGTGVLGDLIDVVEDVGGTVELTYDNFSFVAATIPTTVRAVLEDNPLIALVESDDGIGLPPSPLPPIFGGGGDDCDRHQAESPTWGWERIGADAVEETGEGVDVAILDTGVQTDHCDLAIAGGRNVTPYGTGNRYEDGHGHGTHCAGIAGALANDLGVVGVAPAANCYAVKVLGDDGSGYQSWMAAGIDWCITEEIELISLSLGGGDPSDAMDEAIETAVDQGHLLIAAAGNEENGGASDCSEANVLYPASHEDVLAVSAMDENDTLAGYSSVGDAIDLLAPGTEIESTDVDNQYSTRSGTSMACPFVTGVAALCWEQSETSGPGPNDEVRSVLLDTAKPVLDSCAEGEGLVQASAATDADRSGDAGDRTDDDGVTGTLFGAIRSLFQRIGGTIRRFLRWLADLF